MRTETIAVYRFDELPTEKAKERAREYFREVISSDFSWDTESLHSIETFCVNFGVTLTDWELGPYAPHSFKTDARNSNFRGIKLKSIDREYMPTCYWLDNVLWYTFYDVFKMLGDAKYAFNEALDSGFRAWREDIEEQLSNEYVEDYIISNDYEFDKLGNVYR